jgi:hypothetical protein
MRGLALVLGLSFTLAAAATGALAQPRDFPVVVNVSIGPGLQARAQDFGPDELVYLQKDLRDEVTGAFRRARFVPARVDLVIEDAAPNRPTFAQLSRNVGLSMRSIGVGGARISGDVVGPDGVAHPLHFQFYESDLREERGAATWSDAERSFMFLAGDLAHGRIPNRYVGNGPERNGGHFGYPYTGE